MVTEYTFDELEKYYSEFFLKDLIGYFEKDGFLQYGRFPSRRTHKEWVMFVAFTVSIYSIQVKLEECKGLDFAKRIMQTLGINWLVRDSDYGHVGIFLQRSCIGQQINMLQEIKDLGDIMSMSLDFVIEKLNYFFSSHQSEDYKEICFDQNSVNHNIKRFFEVLRLQYRKYNPSTGLTGMVFNSKAFLSYYRIKYYDQLKKYFKCNRDFNGFDKILYINDQNNNRWEDGHPGDSVSENVMFSIIFMYMIMAEQTFLEEFRLEENNFHKISKWPWISSGPGAGPYLHPLRMLELSGLTPQKLETPLYLDFCKNIFPFLRQEVYTIMNKKMSDILDGHLKAKMKKRLLKEEDNIKLLLETWSNSSEKYFYEIIQKMGFPIAMPYKNG